MLRNNGIVSRLCFVLLLSAGAFSAALYLWVALNRIHYPYQLEWIEGGIFQQVIRITQGFPLYGSPTMEFVPALYTPLFHYLSALVSGLVGHTLFALRLVSFSASMLTCVAFVYALKRLTRAWMPGFVAIGFYLSTFMYTGFWFDVGRVDGLWVMWLAWCVAVLLPVAGASSIRAMWLSAVFFTLSVFTKQSSLFLFPFVLMAVYCWYSPRYFAIFLAASAGCLLSTFCILQVVTGGDFYFYTMKMATSHEFNWHRIDVFLLDNSLYSVPMFIFLSLYFLFCRDRAGSAWGWAWLLLGFATMSAVSRMYAGGVYNVLMPYYMFLSMMAAAGVACLLKGNDKLYLIMRNVLVTGMVVWNVERGWFDPAGQIPDQASREFGDQLLKTIAAVPGRVCFTKDGYLAYLAGKDFCSHNALMADLVNGGNAALTDSLSADVRQKVMSGYYEVIVINNPAELTGFGLAMKDIPYTAYPLPYDKSRFTGKEFYPVIAGPRPGTWLIFNGQHWMDARR
jgi:hypothetical protein